MYYDTDDCADISVVSWVSSGTRALCEWRQVEQKLGSTLDSTYPQLSMDMRD